MPATGSISLLNSPGVTLLAAERGAFAFYRWGNIAINTWASQPTGEAVQILARLTEESLSTCPSGIASVHWIDSSAGLPTAEARSGLEEIARRYERHLLCVGVLLQGTGFWASAVRSALTGIVMLSRRSYALAFHADVPALSRFVVTHLQQRLHDAPGVERLASVIDHTLQDVPR